MSRKRQDIFPQIITVSTNVPSGVADYSVIQFNLPVSRVGTSRNKAQVVEILWVDYYPGVSDFSDNEGSYIMYLSTGTLRETDDGCTYTTFSEDVANPRTMAPVIMDRTFTTSGAKVALLPMRVDLTDCAGNGTLVGTSSLFLVYGNLAGANAASGTAKIAYRIVEVGITEYVGIVESQANLTT